VPFDTLVKLHTLGQLVLLSMGSRISYAKMEDDMDDDKASVGRGGKQRALPAKPFKQMTSREYLDYVDKSAQ